MYKGSYTNSNTFFEAGIQHKSGRLPPSNTPEQRRVITRNKYATSEFQDHVEIWDCRDATPGSSDWLQSLQPGDKVQVYPKARHSGWVNTVASIKVDVYYDNSVLPSPSADKKHFPRVVLYHQTIYRDYEYVSLLPLRGTGLTHLSTFSRSLDFLAMLQLRKWMKFLLDAVL